MILPSVYQFLSTRSPPLCDSIYPDFLPLKHSLPAMTFELDGDNDEQLLDGSQSSLKQALVTINCYDPSVLVASDLAARVKAAMIGYYGPFGTVDAVIIYKESEDAAPETDTGLRGVALQFFVAYS